PPPAFLLGELVRGTEFSFQPRARFRPLPLLDLFSPPVTGSPIAAEVAVPAIRQAFEQRRPAAAARALGGLRGLFVYELRVVAVDRLSLEAVRRGALGQMLDRNAFLQTHGHRV